MIALYIIAGIFCFFICVLTIRAKVHVEYKSGDDVIADVRWAFIKIPLLPREEKEKKPKKPKEEKPQEEEKEEEPEKEKKPSGPNPIKVFYENERLSGVMDLMGRFLDLLYKFGGRLGRCFIFDEILLDLGVTGSDAADTAYKYGRYCNFVFPAYGMVCANCKVNHYAVNVYPDFVARPGNKTEFIITFSLIPRKLMHTVIMLGAGVVFKVGIRFLRGLRKKKAAPASEPAKAAAPETN